MATTYSLADLLAAVHDSRAEGVVGYAAMERAAARLESAKDNAVPPPSVSRGTIRIVTPDGAILPVCFAVDVSIVGDGQGALIPIHCSIYWQGRRVTGTSVYERIRKASWFMQMVRCHAALDMGEGEALHAEVITDFRADTKYHATSGVTRTLGVITKFFDSEENFAPSPLSALYDLLAKPTNRRRLKL